MVPIYRSDGEWAAVYHQGHVFSVDGDWLGFVVGQELYSPVGVYVGYLSHDHRLLRRRVLAEEPPRRQPPPKPDTPRLPASVPLAPMLSELPFHTIDMFIEHPNQFRYISGTRPDME